MKLSKLIQAADRAELWVELPRHAGNLQELDDTTVESIKTLIQCVRELTTSLSAQRLANMAELIDLNYHLVQLGPQVADDIRNVLHNKIENEDNAQ